MRAPVQKPEPVEGSYAWGIARGAVFELVGHGTYVVVSPEAALQWLARRRPDLIGQEVEVLKHLPGSHLGATFVESLGKLVIGSPTCQACGNPIDHEVHRGWGPCF